MPDFTFFLICAYFLKIKTSTSGNHNRCPCTAEISKVVMVVSFASAPGFCLFKERALIVYFLFVVVTCYSSPWWGKNGHLRWAEYVSCDPGIDHHLLRSLVNATYFPGPHGEDLGVVRTMGCGIQGLWYQKVLTGGHDWPAHIITRAARSPSLLLGDRWELYMSPNKKGCIKDLTIGAE